MTEAPSSLLWTFFALGVSIALLLLLIIRIRLPAFFSLLAVSVFAGLLLGLSPSDVISSIQNGMGGLLGNIAVIIGLGSIFGALLEQTGAISTIADKMTRRGGIKSLPWQTSLLGIVVAIPVFFDVALIILASLIYRLSAAANRHIYYVAGPLLAGLAAAHAFIPPTPGPVAVADILNADLGLVIIFGAIAAVPAVAIAGPLFSYAAFDKPLRQTSTTDHHQQAQETDNSVPFSAAIFFLVTPLGLIAGGSILKQSGVLSSQLLPLVNFLSHPFTVLLLIVAIFYFYAATSLKASFEPLNKAAGKALEPAGVVILVTGAGGAFKQILIDSGAGIDVANTIASAELPVIVFAFATAAIVRAIQGSATVAMITAAGLAAPLIDTFDVSDAHRALAVIAIASGATILSHVNDSGFWLVSRYLNLSETETLKSWTITSTLVGGAGFVVIALLSFVL